MPALNNTTLYRGRFAPSPSGALHLGSLVAAVGSYVDAKANNGTWLLRIEDLDPPREVAGAADSILRCLEAHGLHWDEEVSYQSQHHQYYQQSLQRLRELQLTYACDCSRKLIQQQGGHYRGYCRHRQVTAKQSSIRFFNHQPVVEFDDEHYGHIQADRAFAEEDFILRRKDGFYAYHLAMVTDDIRQGVTHVVRGADLLQPSACQLSLYRALAASPPYYLHLPVVVSQPGRKLSKQNHAPALNNDCASVNLTRVLTLLNHAVPAELNGADCASILHWAVGNWSRAKLPASYEVLIPKAENS
ncbi:tRNA glutamyl-Q(34) synthetase GluQRS [Alteromonadaceae bacterium BrNp21-10]|nr:tRNA glutamyl-Q(34) synthetase GluQRS [Alteromonadaceae bacterium BrNp21-10]